MRKYLENEYPEQLSELTESIKMAEAEYEQIKASVSENNEFVADLDSHFDLQE